MANNKMRDLVISIASRIGVPNDNTYVFCSNITPDYEDDLPQNVYALSSLSLNYSILSSNVISTMILTMNAPLSDDNVLKSGQYVTITDNGITVFEGVMGSCNYVVTPMFQDSQGGTILQVSLFPSIYQFTLLPVIFDTTQAAQIQQVTGISPAALLAGGVDQKITTSALFTYMETNSDYNLFFSKTFEVNDLGSSLYLMASLGDTRDTVIRKSIDYYNCVFYQREDGQIVVNQLDYSNKASFSVDIKNQFNNNEQDNSSVPIVPMISYEYQDNAYTTPATISNYALLSANYAVAARADTMVLTYAPNTQYFPRLKELEAGGWFVGKIGNTQINDNIINDPTTSAALQQFFQYPDVFMIQTQASGVKNQFVAGYQALLTAKDTANAISGYSSFTGTISLDDPNTPSNLENVIGTIIEINGLSNMPTGIIATATRSYSPMGSYLTFTVAPPGSYTGFWKNSNNAPNVSS